MIEPGTYLHVRSRRPVTVSHISETGQVMLRADGKLRAFGSPLAFAMTYDPPGGWPEGFVDSLRPKVAPTPPPAMRDELQEQIDFIRWVMS